MLAERNEALNNHKKETSELVRDHILSELPKEVLKLYNQKSNFLRTKSNFSLMGQGLNHDDIYISPEVPSANGSYTVPVRLPDDLALKISKRLEYQYAEVKEIKSLRVEIEATLTELRTSTKVKEQFPEAYKFFPEDEKKINLPVNLTALRNKLK
jgi:hypothetical protein